MVAQQTPDSAYADTLDCLSDGIVCTDVAACVTYMNKAAEAMTGLSRNRAMGRPLAEVVNAILPDREHSATTIRDRHGHATGAVMVLREAQYDALTRLPHRGSVRDRLGAAMAFAHRRHWCLAVGFLDLDGCKAVNDSLGHAAGDQILRSTAARLLRALRQSDTVGRYGGDEFLIVLPEIAHPRDATAIATKLLAAAATPHHLDRGRITLAASLGLAIYPEHGQTVDTLIANADAAMYTAKRAGPGGWRIFDGGIGAATSARRDR